MLQKNYNDIKAFYDENSKFLSDANYKDVNLKDNYKVIFADYEEYFLALTDFDNYQLQYDPINRKIIGTQTIGSQTNDTLTENKIKTYLSKFY